MSAPPPGYHEAGYPGGDKGYAPPPAGYAPPPAGYAPPPAGYAPPPAGQYPPAGGYAPPPAGQYAQSPYPPAGPPPATNTVTVVTTGGGCPNCRGGYFTDDYGCCAIAMAIIFFPIGILCCLAMRERRCTNCGYRA